MPEGDTIHKLADYLAARLVGRRLQRVRMADPSACERCSGRFVCSLSAHGKHLIIELDSALLLRTHLGMYGTWHRYREDEPWRKPHRQASLVLATDEDLFVCFNAKEVELIGAASVRERILQTRLGPDLIDADLDLKLVVRRAREILAGDTPLADLLLDQRVAAGIGNVYKSEVLFIQRRLPRTPLDSVSDRALAACYTTAAELLRRNLGGGPRRTRPERGGADRLWVYGRRGLPCLLCTHQISYARLGKDWRPTYWCGGCQI